MALQQALKSVCEVCPGLFIIVVSRASAPHAGHDEVQQFDIRHFF